MSGLIRKNQKTLVVLILVVVITGITGLFQGTFVAGANLASMGKYVGLYGLLTVGVTFVIITGGIDLSIGALVGVSGVLLPMLLTEFGIPPAGAMGIVLLCGAAIGVIHGLLITKLKLQPFLVTLCGLFIYRSIARSIADDRAKGFGNDYAGMKAFFVKDQLFGIVPMPLVILIVIGVVAAFILNKTVFGRYLLAMGRNEEAARFSGINTDRVKLMAYVICSTLAAFGGMMFVLDDNSATPSIFGNFFELYAIAGAVLGGCSLRGGEGAIAGVILGAALVQVSADAVFFLGVKDTWKLAVIGSFILIGVMIDEFMRRYGERRRVVS